MYELDIAMSLFDEGNYDEALEIYLRLAHEDNIHAQLWVAEFYMLGLGVEKNTLASVRWLQKAAESGNLVAQNNLAIALLEFDPEEAIQCILSTAAAGATPCQSLFGDIYSGVIELERTKENRSQDISRAIEWYKQAGEGGFPYAYHRLGEIYSEDDVHRDIEKAIYYFTKAMEDYYTESSVPLEKLLQQEEDKPVS